MKRVVEISVHKKTTNGTDTVESPRENQLRKIAFLLGGIVFMVFVFPMLFAIFYSYFAHTDAQATLAQAESYAYPYGWIIVAIVWVFGIYAIVGRRISRKSASGP
jgi:uncharacterized membrane protein